MPAPNVLGIINGLRPSLIEDAVKMREAGCSCDTIARFLSDKAKLHVGSESVRRWFQREVEEVE